MDEDILEKKQKALENLILLILGAKDKEISLLHLEKETFLLWNFHPQVREFINFIKHYKGPYSKEISDTIINPFYLEDHWIYTSPKQKDTLSGGHIILTEHGKDEYNRIKEKIENIDGFVHLLSGIKMVRQLYDNLSYEELLLLIYDTYPDYATKSDVLSKIESKKEELARKLLRKGVIDSERLETLIKG